MAILNRMESHVDITQCALYADNRRELIGLTDMLNTEAKIAPEIMSPILKRHRELVDWLQSALIHAFTETDDKIVRCGEIFCCGATDV